MSGFISVEVRLFFKIQFPNYFNLLEDFYCIYYGKRKLTKAYFKGIYHVRKVLKQCFPKCFRPQVSLAFCCEVAKTSQSFPLGSSFKHTTKQARTDTETTPFSLKILLRHNCFSDNVTRPSWWAWHNVCVTQMKTWQLTE